MTKVQLRIQVFNFLQTYGDKMKAKFDNICKKTGSYSVPPELFQKRTSRQNRALISWKAVKGNGLTYEQLNSFEGGVVVEFVNNDFFDDDNNTNSLFNILKNKLGSNENVSSIISIRSDSGSSSSAIPREAFKKLTNNTVVNYHGMEVTITNNNYENYAIKRTIARKGKENDVWNGFLFISIKGGQQDKIETHAGKELPLFNPACEYASADVCEDINLVMGYYALISIDDEELKKQDENKWKKYHQLLSEVEKALKNIEYDFPKYNGNLFDHVKSHYSVTLEPGCLTDPIQLKRITIDKFNISTRTEDSIDFTHEEAVIFEKYYWDKNKKCILSPARPTNIFWSYHLSNMMQQNYTLDEYFRFEEDRFKERQRRINRD